jgi:hypothetical protein
MPDPDGAYRTRIREVATPKFKGGEFKMTEHLYSVYNGAEERVTSGAEPNPVPPVPSGRQITVSRGNPFPPRKGRFADVGGNFDTSKTYASVDIRPYDLRRPEYVYYREMSFNGQFVVQQNSRWVVNSTPLCPVNPSSDLGANPFPSGIRSSNTELNVMGATAVARCEPTNPAADLSVFLGETLKDGLPALMGARTWKDRTLKAKNAGDEFLNYEFGWAPLVSDIRKLANAILHAEKVLSQYEKDAGRPVRRGYHFPLQKDSSSVTLDQQRGPFGFLHSEVMNGATRSPLVLTMETSRDVWFKGSFTYFLPSGYDSRNKMKKAGLAAHHLLGLDLTPEVLWNLAPWSWAIDWFVNVGDVLHNISAVIKDGLVMHYGYIMEHTVSRATYSLPEFRFMYNPEIEVPSLSFVAETKVRREANPYGFGISWDGLSPLQLAILAALGITRKR